MNNLEVIDYELVIAKEEEMLKPILCVCNEHTFSCDEIEMGSVCPKCNRRQDGTFLDEDPLILKNEEESVGRNEDNLA